MKKVISFDKEILFPTMIGEITEISLDHTLKFLTKNDIEGVFVISGRYKMTEASAIEEDFKYTLPIEITLAETFTLDTTKIEIQDFYYEIIDEDILKVKIDLLVEGVEEVLLEEETVEEVVEEELEKLEEPNSSHKEQSEEIKEVREVEVIEPEIEEIKPDVIETISDSPIEKKELIIEEEAVRECDSEEKTEQEKLTDVEPILPEKEEVKSEMKEEKIEDSAITEKEETSTNIQSIFRVFNDAEETYKAYTVYIMRKNDSINTVLDRYKITKEQLEEYNDLATLELGSKVIIPTTND